MRGLYLEQLRDRYARYARPLQDDDRPVFGARGRDRLPHSRLGEPLDIQVWHISKWLDPPRPEPYSWVRLEPDGTISPMEAFHFGDTIHLRPPSRP